MGIQLGDLDKLTGGDQNMAKRFKLSLGELDKASSEIGFDLTKGLLECGLEIDSSGSLRRAYENGSVQETTERALAWVAAVDNNGEFEAGFFDTEAHKTTNLGLSNYKGWVQANRPPFGGTNLYEALVRGAEMAARALNAPQILDLIATKRFGGGYKTALQDLKPIKTDRIFHLTIITDGAPNHGPRPFQEAIKELVVRLSYCGIFIKFIFVGNDQEGRDFLQFMDDMVVAKHPNDPQADDVDWFPGARYIDNVDKVEFLGGMHSVTDPEFAGAMTQELSTYVPGAYGRDLLAGTNLRSVDA